MEKMLAQFNNLFAMIISRNKYYVTFKSILIHYIDFTLLFVEKQHENSAISKQTSNATRHDGYATRNG
jgi:hypothetical protein